MNKAAICFSGQPRNIKKGFEYIQKNFIIPNEERYWEIDVFVHSWFDFSDIGKKYILSKGFITGTKEAGSEIIQNNVLEQIYELYNPKKCFLEKQKYFDEKNYNSRKSTFIKVCNSLSKNYSMMKSCHLKSEFEKENNIKYDAVIFYRFDFGIKSEVLLDNLDLDKINTSTHGVWGGVGFDVSHGYMNSDLSNKYSDFYIHIDTCFNTGIEFSDERLMDQYIKLYNLPSYRNSYLNDYFLIRN